MALPTSSSPSQASHPTLPDTRALPLHLEISRHAYALWESYGRPEGRDVSIWLEAERQLLGTDPDARKQGSDTVRTPPLVGTRYPRGNRNADVNAEPAGIPPESA